MKLFLAEGLHKTPREAEGVAMHAYKGKDDAGKEARKYRPVDSLSSEEQERLANPNWKALVRESLEYKRAHPNIELTRVTKSKGSVTKRIYPGPNGERVSDPSQCKIVRGLMERLAIYDWQDFAPIIEKTQDNVAYALGALRDGLLDEVPLVTKRDKRAKEPGFATRTQDNILYAERSPSFVLLDTCKGIVYVQTSGEITIHSCAHGLSVTYRLRYDCAAIEAAINAAPKLEAVDILCRLAAFSEMTPVEETRLIELAASRSGNKPGDIRKMLKGAKGKKRADASDLYKEIDALNMDHSFVVENGKSLVFHEIIDPVLKRLNYARMTPTDFKTAYANMRYGDTTLGVAWLLSDRRRQYMDGVVFDPANREGKNTLNLWKGFFVKPAPGSWAKLKEHMLTNICGGNATHYDYLMKWMANGVQHPELQGRVAVVMRGKEGVGKGILARTFIYLFGQHGLHISNAKYLIGNFNAHLQDCAALFADEAFFAGDKQHVTEPTLTIERKRIDAVTTPNFLHLMMASNEDWVVPASIDARRFFVLNVGEKERRNEKYFKAILHELEKGGYEAMLDELLKMDLSDFDVAACPDTIGLQDQKKLSLPNEYGWLMEILQRGYVYSSDELDCWNECVSTRLLYASYERFMEKSITTFRSIGSVLEYS